jgi:hypothetical protein
MCGRAFGIIIGTATACFAAANSIPVAAPPAVTPTPLASAYRSYHLKLASFAIPPAGPIGLLMKVRVDGGPILRLLLDSGAQNLVLDRRAAARSGHKAGAGMDLIGAGGPPRTALKAEAATVDIGDIAFRNVPIVIIDGKVVDGIDGAIPLSLFSEFLIHLNVPGRILDLEPYPMETQGLEKGFVPVRAQDHMLFFPARMEREHDGYLLLDTGSSYNVISNAAAARLKRSRMLARSMTLNAGAGPADGRLFTAGVSFQFGERTMILEPVVAVDLSQMCRRHQLEVSGAIGYPALSESVVSVNYRDALVRIANARERRASR